MISKEDSSVISDKLKFWFGPLVVLIVTAAIGAKAQAQMSKMYGTVGLTSNYVDRGITQSKKGPSLNAGMGYWFGPQGRIGFEGASVAYQNESTSVEMRLLTDYKFVFTQATDFKIRVDWVRYFSENIRSKLIATLDLNLFTYHVLASREDNFEGTKRPRNWFALHKDWAYTQSVQINGTVGYSMPEGYDSYFDTRIGASYLMTNITVGVFNTYVSKAQQFGGTADTAFLLELQARF
ncbi:MAG: TorF family putative porin [Pseudobdellovibrionaceae bacterium]